MVLEPPDFSPLYSSCFGAWKTMNASCGMDFCLIGSLANNNHTNKVLFWENFNHDTRLPPLHLTLSSCSGLCSPQPSKRFILGLMHRSRGGTGSSYPHSLLTDHRFNAWLPGAAEWLFQPHFHQSSSVTEEKRLNTTE